MAMQFLLAAIMVATSVASAFAALVLMSMFGRKGGRKRAAQPLAVEIEPTIFLFEERDLADATPPARALLNTLPPGPSDWDRLASFVSTRIPDFRATMAMLAETGRVDLVAPENPNFRLGAEWVGALARLTLSDRASEGRGVVVDGLSLAAQDAEITALREVSDLLPVPVWRSAEDGTVSWANKAYLALIGAADFGWPVPVLFDLPADLAHTGASRRLRPGGDGPAHWFDCRSFASGQGTLNVALPADAIVRAEGTLREFVQTLSKTFADLSVGLAVFDRQRQLALFNPALIDLTSLGAEFLIGRPTLFAFLDRLREARIVPEPKDYTGWRQRMSALEKAAAAGHYEETWTLTTGQTYKVTGRPHPDGAVAFLFEDISAEISLTRRFRSEIEMGQAVVDALDDAVAVFSAQGDLVMSNTAYVGLWGVDPGASLGTMPAIEATRHWASASQPSPVWGDLRDFIGGGAERAEWDGEVTLLDGRALTCRVFPLAGGATLVRFVRPTTATRHVRRLRKDKPAGALHLDGAGRLNA